MSRKFHRVVRDTLLLCEVLEYNQVDWRNSLASRLHILLKRAMGWVECSDTAIFSHRK